MEPERAHGYLKLWMSPSYLRVQKIAGSTDLVNCAKDCTIPNELIGRSQSELGHPGSSKLDFEVNLRESRVRSGRSIIIRRA